MVMVQNPRDAFEKGYADGRCMAEKMRWQGTPIGNVLKGSSYRPDPAYHAAYAEGFRHAMEEACRPEWTAPREPKLLEKNVP
jgi:hypothetical protein